MLKKKLEQLLSVTFGRLFVDAIPNNYTVGLAVVLTVYSFKRKMIESSLSVMKVNENNKQ